jgi:hypothetical protein
MVVETVQFLAAGKKTAQKVQTTLKTDSMVRPVKPCSFSYNQSQKAKLEQSNCIRDD